MHVTQKCPDRPFSHSWVKIHPFVFFMWQPNQNIDKRHVHTKDDNNEDIVLKINMYTYIHPYIDSQSESTLQELETNDTTAVRAYNHNKQNVIVFYCAKE